MRTAALLLTLLLWILTAQIVQPGAGSHPGGTGDRRNQRLAVGGGEVAPATKRHVAENGRGPGGVSADAARAARRWRHPHRTQWGRSAPAPGAPYNWPTYTRPEQITVTEIAYDGRTVSAAMTFWRGSTIHRNAALNEIYREIGVAAMPHDDGYLYIVVLGARPNVLPALVDRKTGCSTLPTSVTAMRAARSGSRARRACASSTPRAAAGSGWQPWAQILPCRNQAATGCL